MTDQHLDLWLVQQVIKAVEIVIESLG